MVCNYCTLRRIKSSVKKEKKKITIKYGDDRELPGWTVVYTYRPGPKPRKRMVAAFMEFTDQCVC